MQHKLLYMRRVFRKGDFVEFMTHQPLVHLQEMSGDGTTMMYDIEEERFVGRIKSVIGNGEAYLLRTFSPLEGFYSVENACNIVRKLGRHEISEEMSEYKESPHYSVPNVYLNTLQVEGSVQEKCEQIACNAMAILFPEEEIMSVNYKDSLFIKDHIVSHLEGSINLLYDGNKSLSRAELDILKDETAEKIRKQRFKEFYSVEVEVMETDPEAIARFEELFKHCPMIPESFVNKTYLVAIDLNFEEVSIMRNAEERTNFLRSLGPEADIALNLSSQFRRKVRP